MGAAGGVRTRGAARGWSGTVETVLGECWDGLGARSIEQQGRVGLGRAGPSRAGRRLPPYLAGGRAERAGRCRAQPLPAPGALRCGSATPTALGGSCGKGEGKGRESRALFARGASASSRLPDGKKINKISILPPAANVGSFWFLYTWCFPPFLRRWVL